MHSFIVVASRSIVTFSASNSLTILALCPYNDQIKFLDLVTTVSITPWFAFAFSEVVVQDSLSQGKQKVGMYTLTLHFGIQCGQPHFSLSK